VETVETQGGHHSGLRVADGIRRGKELAPDLTATVRISPGMCRHRLSA
jgi:hypothetical protein